MSLKLRKLGYQQSGSMLVMALFVLIVLTLLAGTMITIISGSSKSVVHEVYGLRAQQAAHAGIESLIRASFPAGSAAIACSVTENSSLSFATIEGFRNCTYSATCSSSDINFNSTDYRYYQYSSTGFCDTGDGIVSRTLYVDAMQEQLP
ncbi:type II secretory pathway component [Glaciecola sp. SC05]|uniref:type II secretory pathway component n=1 Tax=Glaciecola sp. SC05 TaxID=1987355 RepID=UPI0035298BD2